jgi:hypothetical protein
MAVLQTTKTITSAELLDLHNTDVELIAAQGAGKTAAIVTIIAKQNFNTTAYNRGCELIGKYAGTDQEAFRISHYVVQATATRSKVVQPEPECNCDVLLDDISNKAIVLTCSEAFIDGDGDLELEIAYMVN